MKFYFALTLLPLGFLAACSGGVATGGTGGASASASSNSSGSASSSSGGLSADQACADLSTALCDRLDACTNMLGVKVNYPDAATCVARDEIACKAGLMAPMTSATPDSVEGCGKAIPGESCGDFLDDNPPAACQPGVGQRAAGAPCFAGGQCQSSFCAVPHNAACGTCAAKPKAGDSCAVTQCGFDMVCLRGTMTCAVPIVQGGPCDKDNPCRSGLSCVAPPMMVKGTCQPAGSKVGDACDPKQQTAAGCDRDLGLYCHPMTLMCTAVSFAMAGQPCGVVNNSETICTAGGACNIPVGQKSGTCVAPAADGAACDTQAGPPCLKPARCIVSAGTAGVCTLPDASTCM